MWPTPQDYNEAVQNPGLSFADSELRRAVAEANAFGLPKPRSGSFASVYHMIGTGAEWAVRCFLHDYPDQRQRYAHIEKALSEAALPETVDFSYVDHGIKIRGEWYPVLKMHWAAGKQLNEFVYENLRDGNLLEQVTERFRHLCDALETCGIAHGDLQHGNILVQDGKLKIVDYDGMFTGDLAALGSNEIGHRNYQHPARTKDHFAPYLDRFSAWSIYTSLYCIARDPLLWSRLNGGDECLLFRQSDYRTPRDSPAFRLLEHHKNTDIAAAARALRKLLELELDHLPPLGAPPDGLAKLDDLDPPEALPSWMVPETVDALTSKDTKYAEPPAVQPELKVSDPVSTSNQLVQQQSSGSGSQSAMPPGFLGVSFPTSNSTSKSRYKPTTLLLALLVPLVVAAAGFQTYAAFHRSKPPPGVVTAFDTGNTLYRHAYHLQSRADFLGAMTVYQSALSEFVKVKSEPGAAWCAYQIGSCYNGLRNRQEAIAWMQKAIDNYDANLYVPRIYVDIGSLYANEGELTKAAFYISKGLDRSRRSDVSYDAPVARLLKRVGGELLRQQHQQGLDAYIRGTKYEYAAGTVNPGRDFLELRDLANYCDAKKNTVLAFRIWNEAYNSSLDYPGANNKNTVEALRAMGRIARRMGETQYAQDCEKQADTLAATPPEAIKRSVSVRHVPTPAEFPNPRRNDTYRN